MVEQCEPTPFQASLQASFSFWDMWPSASPERAMSVDAALPTGVMPPSKVTVQYLTAAFPKTSTSADSFARASDFGGYI